LVSASRLFIAAVSAFCAASAAAPAAASSTANTGASVQIVSPDGISIIQDVLAQANVSLVIMGRPGDAVSLAVPSSIYLRSAEGGNLSVATRSPQYASSAILSENAVSVSIGASVEDGSAAPAGIYGGTMLVLAQYN
jgi:hypothetical protein